MTDPKREAQSPRPGSQTAGRIRTCTLSLDELLREVSHPGAGAIATFVGVVRNVNEGRTVTVLEYQAYEAMAEAELDRIMREIEHEIPEVRVATAHRVGTLAVGDVAVACAASAPHRSEAFRACRLLIDRVKARLPIWKREHGPDGPYWIGWADARCMSEAEPSGHEGHVHGHTHT